MTNLHDIINFMFAIIGITLAGLGLTLSLMANNLSLWTQRFFAVFFLMLMGAGTSDLIITLSMSFLGADGVIFTKLGIFGGSIFHISIVIMLSFYGRRDKISQVHRTAFWITLTLPFLALIVQLFSSGIRFVLIGTTISAIIMFVYILKEQAAESARQQLNIKVLRMRPHFIYNIMTSIYYLCELDAHKAQSVIKSFTAYLQKNFSAIVKRDLIPFDEELEHTQAYLAVEKARYEKLLFIEYDTAHKSFNLPPLTLQPIVENAVKHGVDAELEPLHIFIHTARLELANHEIVHEVTVEDSGPGFDRGIIYDYDKDRNIKRVQLGGAGREREHETEEAHIGLNNIIERLRIMCGGTVSIEPRIGGGTVVRLRIKNDRPYPP